MALGKSIEEIRAMSYPSYRTFELFYLLEPFGWHNQEYHAALNAAMLYNINRGKNNKAKEPADFMRDMAKEVLKQLQEAPDYSDLPMEEQRELLKRQIKKDFGI